MEGLDVLIAVVREIFGTSRREPFVRLRVSDDRGMALAIALADESGAIIVQHCGDRNFNQRLQSMHLNSHPAALPSKSSLHIDWFERLSEPKETIASSVLVTNIDGFAVMLCISDPKRGVQCVHCGDDAFQETLRQRGFTERPLVVERHR